MSILFAKSQKSESARQQFRSDLLNWYDRNKRNLPWRRTRQPFRIWVSEIMLQQTRVAAVLEHYKQFIQQFPTVYALAESREPQVLAAWSGLGYYRRARMLHKAAKEVVRRHNGRIPSTTADLQELPGIGRYTAAAIASIAFREAVAVVDGNVERVLARLAGRQLSPKTNWEQAEKLLDRSRPGDFNQGIMELGATICLPQAPLCGKCPVMKHCRARGEITTEREKGRQKVQSRQLMFVARGNFVLLRRRPAKESVMPGMWELPEYRGPETHPLLKVKHSIMDTDYEVRVFAVEENQTHAEGKWISHTNLSATPLTGMARKILRKLNWLE